MMTPKEIELAYKRVEYLNVVIDSWARLAARALLDGEPEAAYRFAKRMAGTEKVRDRIADSRARLAARALLDGEPEAAYRFAKRMAGTEKVRDRIAAQLNQAVTDKEQS